MAGGITSIILAAGVSSRMGVINKTLLPFAGKSIIETTVDAVINSVTDEVIVVLGFESAKVRAVLAGRAVRFVENDNYTSGMTSSIQSGVQAANPGSDGYLICLSDMPLLTSDDYNLIMGQLKPEIRCIVKPFFQGEGGNPVLFSAHFKEAILQHQQAEGCRGLVQANKEFVISVEFDNNRILSDIDTSGDYSTLSS
jgi:molybdenum cofactor cytidylyltransferase